MTVSEFLAILKDAKPDMPVFIKTESEWRDAKAVLGACSIEDAEGEVGYVFGVLIDAE